MKYVTGVISLALLVALTTVGSAADSCDRDNMRRAGAAFLALRDDVAAKNLETARAKVSDLVQGTKDIQLYWTLRNVDWLVDDGVKWSREAHDGALAVKSALDAGKLEDAALAVQKTLQSCNACHQKYRPARRTAQPAR